MWLCNMRGEDIENNPLFISYAIFKNEHDKLSLDLYVDPEKVKEADVVTHLTLNSITVHSYDNIYEDI